MFSKGSLYKVIKCHDCMVKSKVFPKQQIFVSSKLKEFADDNVKFDDNGRESSKWVETTVEKGEIARYKQFLLFSEFSKDLYCTHIQEGHWPWSACLRLRFCVQNTSKMGFDLYISIIRSK